MSCAPSIKTNSNLGRQLGLTKDTSFNNFQELAGKENQPNYVQLSDF